MRLSTTLRPTWTASVTPTPNTIEGFWTLLKRGLFGQFHSVSPRHLQRYVDEFCFRYNLRGFESDDMFTYTIFRCLGVI